MYNHVLFKSKVDVKWWVLNGWILPSGRIPSVRVCFKKEATPEEKNHTEYTPNRCIFHPIRSSEPHLINWIFGFWIRHFGILDRTFCDFGGFRVFFEEEKNEIFGHFWAFYGHFGFFDRIFQLCQ